MITTIQIHGETKRALERAKASSAESYEAVIKKLLAFVESRQRSQEQLLIEGYKTMAADSIRITKEWDSTDAALDWEWQ